jgi:histidinol dehydrogenase
MIKILDSKVKNFESTLDKILSKRKNKVQRNSVSVTKIIKDVKKNGDKAILKYEKRFNKNSTIIPNPKK